MKIKPIAEIVAFLQPVAKEVGVEIVDCTWDTRTSALTFYIDKAGGIDLDTCEAFHRAIDEPLDELDPTYGAAYTLNCSSPGLDRPFKTEADFARHLGEKIELHLYAPIDGKKYYEGDLVSFAGGNITFLRKGKEKTIPFSKTSKVCLCIEV